MANNQSDSKKKGGIRVYIPLFIIVALILGAGIYWYREYTRYVKTDDAYVDTDNIAVSSKMLGRILTVYVEEGDKVKQGELLAELDSSDIVAKRIQALAAQKQAETSLAQAQAQYQYSKESIKINQVSLDKAQSDFKRAKDQYDGGVIPEEQYDHSKQALDAAKAQLEAVKSRLKVVKAQIESAKAAIASSKAQIGVIQTQLDNTRLYAPITGIVAKRWLLPGDVVQPSQSVFTVTNNHKLWVMVYLEETKIAGVHLNQSSLFTVDAFPGITFTGKVFSIGSNTASQFSLIPPSNASGNFTKVTQRIPVKISIDGTEDDQKLSSFEILAGMSVVVKIVKN
ncbi:MAG TPA: HlyD family secretion protein [Sunxiuqinia sp.]|nr:HlyD family secretion protein [Sunxiuqinia sp.]